MSSDIDFNGIGDLIDNMKIDADKKNWLEKYVKYHTEHEASINTMNQPISEFDSVKFPIIDNIGINVKELKSIIREAFNNKNTDTDINEIYKKNNMTYKKLRKLIAVDIDKGHSLETHIKLMEEIIIKLNKDE